MSRLLKIAEVARILAMSRQHVCTMMDRGQIPYVRIPGTNPRVFSRRIDSADLDRWIEEHKTAA